MSFSGCELVHTLQLRGCMKAAGAPSVSQDGINRFTTSSIGLCAAEPTGGLLEVSSWLMAYPLEAHIPYMCTDLWLFLAQLQDMKLQGCSALGSHQYGQFQRTSCPRVCSHLPHSQSVDLRLRVDGRPWHKGRFGQGLGER